MTKPIPPAIIKLVFDRLNDLLLFNDLDLEASEAVLQCAQTLAPFVPNAKEAAAELAFTELDRMCVS